MRQRSRWRWAPFTIAGERVRIRQDDEGRTHIAAGAITVSGASAAEAEAWARDALEGRNRPCTGMRS